MKSPVSQPPARVNPTQSAEPTRRVRAADVLRLAEDGVLAPAAVTRALQLTGSVPSAAGWLRLLDRLLVGVGATLLLAGVVCLVAYNWAGLGRWARFGLAQAALLLVLAAAAWVGPGTRYGKLLLTATIVLVGPLLALFGQTYQTGADLSDLFRSWALLTLPWVLASRFAPAWLVWLVIAEAWLALRVQALDLWWDFVFGGVPTWLLACALNAVILALWEFAATRFAWLRGDDLPAGVGRGGPWLVATVLLALLTGIVCALVFDVGPPGAAIAPVAWLVVLAAGYRAYRIWRVDLVMLALGWTALTAVLLALALRLLGRLDSPYLSLLVASLVVVMASIRGRQWLAQVARVSTWPAGGRTEASS